MSQALFYAAVAACFLVLAVLAVGVFSFARGGEFNRKYSNKIMRLRIVTQAIAVVLILAAVLAARSGS
ncbi:MAG: twin transmembrane helix small protein [Pseudomonadota bacterium]